MAPKKKSGEATAAAVTTSPRRTRRATAGKRVAPPPARSSPAKKQKVAKGKGKGKKADEVAPPAATAAGGSSESIIIEACKQCNSFKTRAFAVKDGLKSAIPGIEVILNPEKPRRGCFEVRRTDGEIFISLLDMKRPFTPMKNLDMEKVVEDIVKKIK